MLDKNGHRFFWHDLYKTPYSDWQAATRSLSTTLHIYAKLPNGHNLLDPYVGSMTVSKLRSTRRRLCAQVDQRPDIRKPAGDADGNWISMQDPC
jgi:hypothetical protein